MNKLEQVNHKIKISNPEIGTKFSPTEDFLLLIDKFGTKAVVTVRWGRVLVFGVGKNKTFQRMFDSYRSFIDEKDKNYLYKMISIFDSGRRYDSTKTDVPFGKRFVENDSFEPFLDDIDNEAYNKEINDVIDSKTLYFGRWKLNANQGRDRLYLDAMYSKSVRMGEINFATSKHDLLFAWYILTNRLSKDFNLATELECFYKFLDDDRVKQLEALKQDWDLTV